MSLGYVGNGTLPSSSAVWNQALQIVNGITAAAIAAQHIADDGLYVPVWKPFTAYAAGQYVANPAGDVVSAKVAFTSGVAYLAANWNILPNVSDRDNGHPGMIAPGPNVTTTTSAAVVSNRAYYARFCPSRVMTPTLIAFRVQGFSATDDPCCVSLFDASGTQIASSGSVLGKLNATTGTKPVPITSPALAAGAVYYASFQATSTATLFEASIISDGFGPAIPQLESAFRDTTFPTPTSMAGALAVSNLPVLWIRES